MSIRIRTLEHNSIEALKTQAETVLISQASGATNVVAMNFSQSLGSYRLMLAQYFTSIGSVTFVGSGLNDLTAGGTPATEDAFVEVEIDGEGTPDTFKWRINGGAYTEGVAITGSAQALSNGVTVTFGATTGHTSGESWSFQTMIP